jgi:alpha-tubulin suppressor-like RCC1 family protein
MSGFFSGNDGDFDRVFMTTTDLIDQFVGESLFACGYNYYGTLGDNTSSNRSSLVQITGGGVNWSQVSVIGYNSAAIKTDGTLWTWGINNSGQLGTNNTTNRSSPVTTAGGGTNWKQVYAGNNNAAAIKTDGTLWIWGLNSSGQLGTNNSTNRSSPVTTVAGGTNWKQVACGQSFTSAIKTDGTLWTWGNNASGVLGDNTTSTRSSPVTTVAGGTNWKQVACSIGSIAAIKTDGTLWTCGYNLYGQLGDGTSSNRSSPVTTSGGGTNWKQVACGVFSTAAIKTDGTLWTWGRNSFGELGDNTTSSRSSPVTTVAGGTNWKQVACAYSIAAIKTDGTLWTWGRNTYGGLGHNNTSNRSSPVQPVGSFNNWKQVTCGYTNTIGIVQKV